MVEVFKTNVKEQEQATMLIGRIHSAFSGYEANFDLEDCDKVLRVKCTLGHIQPLPLIRFLNEFGFDAEVLPDSGPPVSLQSLTTQGCG
jgi:hypothetical protein